MGLEDSTSVTTTENRQLVPGWRALGLTLAIVMAGGAGVNGFGTVAAAIVFASVIYALVRLRSRAPGAATTGDLVASTLGRGAGSAVTVAQTAAYAALAAVGASAFGLAVLFAYVDDAAGFDTWLWPTYGVAGLAVTATTAYVLPARVTAAIAAILAGVATLTLFYLALALIAKALTDPDIAFNPIPDAGPWTVLTVASALAYAAQGLIGVELITTQSDRVASIAKPMVGATVVAVVVAVVCWFAVRVADPDVARINGVWVATIATDVFGDAAWYATAVITISLSLAGLLAVMLGIVRLTGTMEARRVPEVQLVGVLAVTALLTVGACREWLHVDSTLPWVAALLLLLVYAVVIEAHARLDDSQVGWWLRIVMPLVFVAMIVLPMITARSIGFMIAPLLATVVIALVAAGVGVLKERQPTG